MVKWKEQKDFCYRCCTTWGETVIKIQCDKTYRNATVTEGKEQDEKAMSGEEKKTAGDAEKNPVAGEEKKPIAAEEKKPVAGEEKDPQRELGFS